MFKRITVILMAVCFCMTMFSVAFAAEDISTVTETADVELNSDGWSVLEVPVSPSIDGLMPLGGTETWKATSFTRVGTFTMEGNNLTPVKTIGADRDYLILRIDSFSCSKKVKLTVNIEEAYTEKVLGSRTSSLTTSGGEMYVLANVAKGDKVQIYFRIVDANGKYDDNLKCTITYSYCLSNSPAWG